MTDLMALIKPSVNVKCVSSRKQGLYEHTISEALVIFQGYRQDCACSGGFGTDLSDLIMLLEERIGIYFVCVCASLWEFM